MPLSHRPVDCPLIEVPYHGRLIDADKMLAELETLPFGDRKVALTLLIANAPTIIPAEPPKGES